MRLVIDTDSMTADPPVYPCPVYATGTDPAAPLRKTFQGTDPCPVCLGTGTFLDRNGELRPCPRGCKKTTPT